MVSEDPNAGPHTRTSTTEPSPHPTEKWLNARVTRELCVLHHALVLMVDTVVRIFVKIHQVVCLRFVHFTKCKLSQ